MKMERIYVCHTFYHVYVAMLKECNLKEGTPGMAEIALSRISTNFGNLKERLEKTGLFHKVYDFDEKREDFFPELAKYRKNYHNPVKHLINRIIFTKKLPKCEEPYMIMDFKQYKDIYVFCDSDPIGYYLNYKKIQYHAVEDGLDCLKNLDDAHVANYGHFGLKALLAKWNLIFIMNGFSKYCLDMEVNDISVVPGACDNLIELPRRELANNLTSEQKTLFQQAFIEDYDGLVEQLSNKKENEEFAMFLTEPHPVDEEARKKVCVDIINKYCQGYRVLIKPHPRDMIDYEKLCPQCVVIRGRFPIEVLNTIEGIHVKKAISIVTTAMDAIDFVDEKINLGASFWDDYEDPALHAYNKKVGLSLANK